MKDSIDRRGFLACSAWAGAGIVWALVGGVPKAFALGNDGAMAAGLAGSFHFTQISDTHVGFNKEANPDALKTTQEAIDRIVAMPVKPSLILHTGDITHLSKPQEFDTAAQMLSALPAQIHYVPGEHDTLDEGGGKAFLDRYGKGTKGNGWYSFDDHGVHFIALINVFDFQPGHEAHLGPEQLQWLADDLRAISPSTPIVVFTHIPLWSIYSAWGWGTEDGAAALDLLRGYGSVTVLNGHIHQIIQKVEGNITFHTARSTSFLQPAPGEGTSPGPIKAPDGRSLRDYLGITDVNVAEGSHPFTLIDSTLSGI